MASEVPETGTPDGPTSATPPRRPGPVRYIVAYLLAVVISAALVRVSNVLLAPLVMGTITSLQDYAERFPLFVTISVPVAYFVTLVVMILVYEIFRSLNLSKAMPWIWILGGAAAGYGLYARMQSFETARIDFPLEIHVVTIGGFFLSVLSFYGYFRLRGRFEKS